MLALLALVVAELEAAELRPVLLGQQQEPVEWKQPAGRGQGGSSHRASGTGGACSSRRDRDAQPGARAAATLSCRQVRALCRRGLGGGRVTRAARGVLVSPASRRKHVAACPHRAQDGRLSFPLVRGPIELEMASLFA